jgi:hypothetical protein
MQATHMLVWNSYIANLPLLGQPLNHVAQIILQFLYFHYRKQREPSDEHDDADKA